MNKTEKYEELLARLASLLEGETDVIAQMANMAAEIHRTFGFWWTGFYRVVEPAGAAGADAAAELILGPFQGPLACMHIAYGRGVCGTSWMQDRTVVVEDVEQFPGHIACSSESRSEIVIPVHAGGKVVAVLDIDSENLSTFDSIDALYLEKCVKLINF